MEKKLLYLAMAALFLSGMTACDDDDDDDDNFIANSTITIENVTTVKSFVQSGTFQMTGTSQSSILPGESVSITFNAAKGQALMFASMYGNSNDLFFAPKNPGINLFHENGTPLTGNVSDQVFLWDNGTRVNQAPGTAVSHPGTAESGVVTLIDGGDTRGNTYLPASELMEVTLVYSAAKSEFTLVIKNISAGKANETPFSPGVWVVANKVKNDLINAEPFFIQDKTTTAALTQLAENGNNKPLADWAQANTGIITQLSPVLVVVYSGTTNPIYTLGEKDKKLGLKEFAQTGVADKLKASLEGMGYVHKVYVIGYGAVTPGEKVEAQFESITGYNIAFASMFGHSNDWFFANTETLSSQTKGDVTSKIGLFDSGTGVDQYPGAGNSQALFEGTPAGEDKVISKVGTTYPVPEVSKMIKVTLK